MRTSSSLSTLAVIISLFAGCVSVSIGPAKPSAAKNVKFSAPPSPYVSFSSDEVDAGWKNSQNGTSISYKSSCGDVLDLPLESIQQSMLYGIDNLKVIKSQRIPFCEREALNSIVVGKVDGVDTKMELVILKKNRCTYMLNYVSILKSFDSDQKVFQDFIKTFEAP